MCRVLISAYEVVHYSSLICNKNLLETAQIVSSEWVYSSDSGLLMLRVSAMRGGIFLLTRLLSCTLVTTTSLLPLQSPLYTHTALVTWPPLDLGLICSSSLYTPSASSSLFWFVSTHIGDMRSEMKVIWNDLVVTSASDQICDCVQWPRPDGNLRGQRQTEVLWRTGVSDVMVTTQLLGIW